MNAIISNGDYTAYADLEVPITVTSYYKFK